MSKSASSQKKAMKPTKPNLYQQVTDDIVKALEAGDIPWYPDKMWRAAGSSAEAFNVTSGKTYRGFNAIMLSSIAVNKSIANKLDLIDPRFCTFNQAKDRGWHVKKGAKSIPVLFFKKMVIGGVGEKDKSDGKEKRKSYLDIIDAAKKGGRIERKEDADSDQKKAKEIFVLRQFRVFHATDIEGIPPLRQAEVPWVSSAVVDEMLNGLKAQGMGFLAGGDEAGYSSSTDTLMMPPKDAFDSSMTYDSVLAHEMGHATGHKDRLDRDISKIRDMRLPETLRKVFQAKEEFVAEMVSAMLSAKLGLSYDVNRHADYIGSWLKILKDDVRFVMRAAGKAAKACDYLMDLVPEVKAQMEAHRRAISDCPAAVDLSQELGDSPDDTEMIDVEEVMAAMEEYSASLPVQASDLSEFDLDREQHGLTMEF